MTQTYYSPFLPAVALPGAKGSTVPILTPAALAVILEDINSTIEIGADGSLTPVEKQLAIRLWNDINNEFGDINTRATTLGITTAKNDWIAEKTALGNYLAALLPAWNDTSVTTPIVRTDWNGNWSDYYNARIALEQKISEEDSTRATWDGVTGAGKDAIVANVNALLDIGDDDKLTAVEKQVVIRERADVTQEHDALNIRRVALSITTEWNEFSTALTNLNNYLGTLTPNWDNTLLTTVIDRAVWRSTWLAVYSKLMILRRKISEEDAKKATWNQVTGVGRPQNYATASDNMIIHGDFVYGLEGWTIESGVAIPSVGGGGSPVGSSVALVQGENTVLLANNGTPLAIDGVTKLYISGHVYATAAANLTAGFRCYNASGTLLGVVNTSISPTVFNSYRPFSLILAPLAGTVRIVPVVRALNPTTDQYVSNLRYSKTEVGATLGAPAGTLVGSVLAEDLVAQAAIAATDSAEAKTDADAAILAISKIVDNNILDSSEKSLIVREYNEMLDELAGIEGRATAFGITTEKTAYTNALSALTNYLATILPAYNFMTASSPIVRADFDLSFRNFYTARQALINKISEIAGLRAAWAFVRDSDPNAPDNNATEGAPSGTMVSGVLAQNLITQVNSTLEIGDDDKLTAVEKQDAIRVAADLTAEYNALNTRRTALNIVTEWTTFQNATIALQTYLNTLTPAWNDTTQSTNIVRATWRSNWGAVYSAKAGLELRISEEDAKKALWVNIVGQTNAPANNATVGAIAGTNLLDSGGIVLSDTAVRNADQLWLDIEGVGLPANNATNDLTLVSFGALAVSIVGNTTKASATTGYGNVVRGPVAIGSSYCEMDIPTAASGTYAMLAMDESATDVDWAIQQIYFEYLPSTGSCYISRNGSQVFNASIGVGLIGKARITFDKIRYRTFIGTVEVVAGNSAMLATGTTVNYPKFYAYLANSTVTGLRAGAESSSNLWAEMGGTGLPANNATVGAIAGLNLYDSGGIVLSDTAVRNADQLWLDIEGVGLPANNATNDRYVDTRNDNQPPSWYYTNYSFRTAHEFKDGWYLGILGVPAPGYYGSLVTRVDYQDASGGPIFQEYTVGTSNAPSGMVAGQNRIRYSTGASTWSAWAKDFSALQPPRLGSSGELLTEGGAAFTDALGRNDLQRFDQVVAGFGRPANNATVGATLGTNLYGGGGAALTSIEVLNADQLWLDIEGVGLPENNATSSDSLIKNGSFLNNGASWLTIAGNVSYTQYGAGSVSPVPAYVYLGTAGSEARANNGALIELHGAKKLFISGYSYRETLGTQLSVGAIFRRADGSACTVGQGDVNALPASAFVWMPFSGSVTPPTDCTQVYIYMYSGSGSTILGGLRVAKTENAATLGARSSVDLRDSGGNLLADTAVRNSDQLWTEVNGAAKPSDYAGTSGFLTNLGLHTVIRGNSVYKNAGTHGAWEGGAVGTPTLGAQFVSGSIIHATVGGGWTTAFALDDDNTTFSRPASKYYMQATVAPNSALFELYENGVALSTPPSVAITANSRPAMVYDGTQVYMSLDGVRLGSAIPAAAGQKLWPKVIDYFVNGTTAAVKDIMYGPYADVTGSGVTMTPNNAAAYFVAGNTVSQVVAAGGWTTKAVSKESFRGGISVSGLMNTGGTFIGLHEIGATDTTFGSLAFSIHRSGNGTWAVYNGYASPIGLGSSFTSATLWTITYDGQNVRYYADGVLLYQQATFPNRNFQLGVAINAAGEFVSALQVNAFTNVANTVGPKLVARGNGLFVEGSRIYRQFGGGTWDSDCYSVDGYTGGAECSFVFGTPTEWSYSMVGLNTDPTTDMSYTSLDYCWYQANANNMHIYESGANPVGFGALGVAGDIFSVTYDGVNVRYLHNGTIMRTVAAPPNLKLHFDCSVVLGELTLKSFGPMTNNDFAATGGGTKPENNATVGAIAGNNLRDSGGAVLVDAAIKNSQQLWGEVNGVGRPANDATVGARAGTNLLDAAGAGLNDAAIKNSQQLWGEVSGVGRPANDATVGARAGTNLLDAAGAVLVDAAIKNSQQLWGEVNGVGRPENYSTYGAKSGDNLRDSGNVVLSDNAIRNYRVENNVLSVALPEGGSLDSTAGAGAIRILLPVETNTSYSMIDFEVQIYEYNAGASQTYKISGYTYSEPTSLAWINCTARYSGKQSSVRPIYFGRHSTGQWAVWIGDPTATWSYPKVLIRNLEVGHSGVVADWWKDGWQLSFDAAARTNTTVTIANPVAGDSISGVNTLRANGVLVDDALLMNDNQRFDMVVAGFGRPSDNATRDTKLIVRGSSLTLSGNTVTRPVSSGAWDADCYSAEGYTGGAFASFILAGSNPYLMAGLNTDPISTQSYESLDYVFFIAGSSDPNVYAYESNISVGALSTYVTGDVLAVTYDGVNVRYSKNGTVLRTIAAPANAKMHFDSSIIRGDLEGINFGPMSNNDFASTGGATKPEDGADVTSVITGPTKIVIDCDSNGTPIILPAVTAFKLFKSGADITTSATWAASVLSGTFTQSFGTAGQHQVTALSTVTGRARITATIGTRVRSYEVEVEKKIAPAATGSSASGGTSATAPISFFTTSTAMVTASPELVFNTGSAGTATMTGVVNFEANAAAPTGLFAAFWVWQLWNGSGWVDQGSEVAATVDSSVEVESSFYWSNPGTLQVAKTINGLTASAQIKFRLNVRNVTARTYSYYTLSNIGGTGT